MRLLLVGVAVGLAAAAAPPAPLPPASQLLAVSPPLYHGSFPLHFRLPADAQAGTDVVSIKVVRPSLASTRGALLSSLLHVDISPEPASAPHCSLEAFTHGAGLSTRRAGATTGDALRIALPPTGDDALLLVRCAAPAPWSLSSSPSSAAFSVTTSLVVEPRLRVRLMSGLALLALAPSLARCAPAYYATSMLASAILLALLVGVWVSRSAPGSKALRTLTGLLTVAATTVFSPLTYLRDAVIASYVHVALWPVRYALTSISTGEADPYLLAAAAAAVVVSSAAGFALTRTYLVSPTSNAVLPGPQKFVLVLLRAAASVLVLTGVSDPLAGAALALLCLSIACAPVGHIAAAWGVAQAAAAKGASVGAAAAAAASPLISRCLTPTKTTPPDGAAATPVRRGGGAKTPPHSRGGAAASADADADDDDGGLLGDGSRHFAPSGWAAGRAMRAASSALRSFAASFREGSLTLRDPEPRRSPVPFPSSHPTSLVSPEVAAAQCKAATDEGLRCLAASPEFSVWFAANAGRITVSPIRSFDDDAGLGGSPADVARSGGGGGGGGAGGSRRGAATPEAPPGGAWQRHRGSTRG